MSHPTTQRITRRRLLGSGAAAGAALATMPAAPTVAQALPPDTPAMRSPHKSGAHAAAAGLPNVPSVEIIALSRMAFGPRPGDLNAFRQLGDNADQRLTAYVEQQLNPAAMDDTDCDNRLAAEGFTTMNKSLAQLWADHVKGDADRYNPAREVERATFLRAVYSKRQLLEVLADFWHNHFNVHGWDYWIAPVFVHYDRDVIRAHALGNFHTMLKAVAQSPAMLYYLDNISNNGGNPNENYARELFELHTMGAENYLGVVPLEVGSDGRPIHPAPKDENGRPLLYVDADVYGATTCFTGWQIDSDSGQFEFNASDHFPYLKLVLGQAIPEGQGIQDGHDVLSLLANHPGTARHIAGKLCRRLISDNPPETVVDAAAATFMAKRNHDDQLKEVVRTILLSDAFRTTWAQKIKRPFELSVSVLRATNADFQPVREFFWSYNDLGQALFDWRPPDGYPDAKEDWSSTMPMLQRWRHINWLLGWRYGGEGENKDVNRILLQRQMPASVLTPNAMVDWWSRRLVGLVLPAAERTPIVEFLAGGRNPDYDLPADQLEERLSHMVSLILMSPSFQWR